jgi:hypothetical protein
MWHPDQVTEDDLKAAVEAHDKAIEDARTQRDQAIAQAARDGMRPTAIVKATGYTREHIRRILRAQGIEADRG